VGNSRGLSNHVILYVNNDRLIKHKYQFCLLIPDQNLVDSMQHFMVLNSLLLDAITAAMNDGRFTATANSKEEKKVEEKFYFIHICTSI
jgi:hypothetical protein